MGLDVTTYGMTGVYIKTIDGVDYDKSIMDEKYDYLQSADAPFDSLVDGMCGDYIAIGEIHFSFDMDTYDDDPVEMQNLDTEIDTDKLQEIVGDLFGKDFKMPEVKTFIFQHVS